LDFYKLYFPYIAAGLFVGTWWIIAFSSHPSFHAVPFHQQNTIQKIVDASKVNLEIDRQTLHEALSGNYTLMAKLIAEWDIDAQLLNRQKVTVKRLPNQEYVQSQLLARKLSDKPLPSTDGLKFLPQTYIAASFLLALVPPNQIVALPAGLREQTDLFPINATTTIDLDTDRYNSENIFLSHPDIAYVSEYSHPNTLQAFKNQSIALSHLPAVNSVADIYLTLAQIGETSHRMSEAKLLAIFIKAALNAIDNQINALNIHSYLNKVLYVNHYRNFSTPTEKTIIGQLLRRLGITWGLDRPKSAEEWTIPLKREELILFNPKCVIISSILDDQDTEFFMQTTAYEEHNIYFVDETIQSYSSQYIVLAYYDLYRILTLAKFS